MGRRGSSRRSKGLYVPRWTVNIIVAPFSFPLHPSLLHLLYKAECIHVQWTTRIPRDLDGGTPSYRVRGVCHLSWGGSYSLGDTNACFLRFIFTTRIFFFLLLLLLLFFFFLLPPLLFSFSFLLRARRQANDIWMQASLTGSLFSSTMSPRRLGLSRW